MKMNCFSIVVAEEIYSPPKLGTPADMRLCPSHLRATMKGIPRKLPVLSFRGFRKGLNTSQGCLVSLTMHGISRGKTLQYSMKWNKFLQLTISNMPRTKAKNIHVQSFPGLLSDKKKEGIATEALNSISLSHSAIRLRKRDPEIWSESNSLAGQLSLKYAGSCNYKVKGTKRTGKERTWLRSRFLGNLLCLSDNFFNASNHVKGLFW